MHGSMSCGHTCSYILDIDFFFVMISRAALLVDFKGLGGYPRLLSLAESPYSGPQISIEVIGSSVGTLHFNILPLSYYEFETRFSDVNLNDIFSIVPPPNSAGGIVINVQLMSTLTILYFCVKNRFRF